MFAWLENIISCELPHDKGPIPEHSAADTKKPLRPKEDIDPHLDQQPQATELDDQSFEYEFTEFLRRLAVECNWHMHNDTCYKHLKHGKKRGDANCQMRLDGTVQEQTMLDVETGSIELRWWWGHINNFTDLILFLLQCNTDTQFIGSGEAAKAAVFYITEYITKGNVPMYVGLQALDFATKMHDAKYINAESVNEAHKRRNLITKSVNAMMGRQETSHQQVMSYLVGGRDHYTSHTFKPFKWFEFVNAATKFEHDAKVLEPDDVADNESTITPAEAITVNILTHDVEFTSDLQDYILRPSDVNFANLTLWEFAESVIKEKGKLDVESHDDGKSDDSLLVED
ncbi:uncharacterized protein HD556DRAFT_1443442 [Suillus plorans]|uniref:Uncharacterized protein n=1 Tax=Suillus plorans TaxID=116603 RepID=A0A9P7DI01_9AGAM|nr:uncharacterized protein HD556DRAFT_1443442 [Suillus plorans]KAG1793654.1 hypothetical protein HD556DRAFT_1443442 [Suillus plorans]